MNKKGFTLVELMAVIAIIIFIGLIVTPGVLDIIKENREKGYSEIERRLEEAAAKYITDEYIDPNVDTIVITKQELIDAGYIKEVYDLKDNSVCQASIYVYNLNSLVDFNPILTCSNYETKGRNAVWYIKDLFENEEELNNGLINPKVTYEGKEYDTGIRYSGSLEEVKNKVYYNCNDTDVSGVSYGKTNYDYASSCEVWRIIGVFDVDDGEGNVEKRIKLINTASTFTASLDSSTNDVNNGWGVNQWGPSGSYEGADIMQLLNGFYIGKNGAECKYCNNLAQEECKQTCTSESLKGVNMKVLTSTAKEIIEIAVWDTYGVSWADVRDVTWAPTAYLQEKGISTQYTGKMCNASSTYQEMYLCTDTVERTTSWTGLVGLMSVADIAYADGWLYKPSGTSLYPRSISPYASSVNATLVWNGTDSEASHDYAYNRIGVFASVYLKASIKIIDGNGYDKPYILGM